MVDVDIWAQRLTHYLQDHMDTERDALRTYAHLAEETKSDRIRFVINMILDDEMQHHRMFQDMINWLRAEHSQREDIDTRIGRGSVTTLGPERPKLLELTDKLLEMDQRDERELKELDKMVGEVADTAWWTALVESIRLDTRKRAMLLGTVKELASET